VPFQALKRKATISTSTSFQTKERKWCSYKLKDIQGLPQIGELSNIGTRAMVLLLSNQVEKIPIIKTLLPCESTLENTLEMWIKGGKTG
jgi:hypothetical protein